MQTERRLRPGEHRLWEVWKNSGFLVFWLGRIVSMLGDMLFSMATMWYVYGKTASALGAAGVVLIPMLCQLIISQPFATLADRLPKKATMVGSDVFRGIVILGVGCLMVAHRASSFDIYAATALLTVASFLFGPAQSSLVPNILRNPKQQLATANSILSATRNVLNLAGYAIGGVLVAIVHPTNAVLLDGTSFLLSALSIAVLRVSALRSEGERGIWGFVKDSFKGVQFIWERPALRTFGMYVLIINLVSGPASILTIVFSREVLHAGLRGYGFLEASWSVGGVFGAMFSAWASKRLRMWHLQLLALVGTGLALVSMPVFSNLAESVTALIVASVVITMMNIPFFTALQLLAPGEIRGRVFAAFGLFAGIGDPLGLLVGSWLMGRIPPTEVYLVSGLLLVLCGVIGVCFPVIRKGEEQLNRQKVSGESDTSAQVK